MTTKEHIVQQINEFSQAELEQVAQYLAFIKYQSRIKTVPALDEARWAALYAEAESEDRELAEEGMADYADALAREDTE